MSTLKKELKSENINSILIEKIDAVFYGEIDWQRLQIIVKYLLEKHLDNNEVWDHLKICVFNKNVEIVEAVKTDSHWVGLQRVEIYLGVLVTIKEFLIIEEKFESTRKATDELFSKSEGDWLDAHNAAKILKCREKKFTLEDFKNEMNIDLEKQSLKQNIPSPDRDVRLISDRKI